MRMHACAPREPVGSRTQEGELIVDHGGSGDAGNRTVSFRR
jgi:hypothetical protein